MTNYEIDLNKKKISLKLKFEKKKLLLYDQYDINIFYEKKISQK